MLAHKDYVAGWLSSTVCEFIKAFPRTSRRMQYALVTCLDSNPRPESMREASPALRALGQSVHVLGSGLLIPVEDLTRDGMAEHLFSGFDEVWFFPTNDVRPKPGSPWLVGPGRLTQEKINLLGKWMVENSCVLGLGDGEGLNFIVKARGMVKYLLAHTLDQPSDHLSVC